MARKSVVKLSPRVRMEGRCRVKLFLLAMIFLFSSAENLLYLFKAVQNIPFQNSFVCLQKGLANNIPFYILEEITDGFSPDRIVGTGGYGNIYKVVLITWYFFPNE